MANVMKKIMDVITIVGPAVSAVLAALGMAEIVPVFDKWYGVALVILGAVSSVASVAYNAFDKSAA